MDQNNEKPVKESVFLAEVIVIMVVNLLKAIIVVSMLLHNGCYFKRYFFFRRENMPPPWVQPVMPLPAQNPPQTPPHNTQGDLKFYFAIALHHLFFLQPELQWIGLLKLMILHLIRLL